MQNSSRFAGCARAGGFEPKGAQRARMGAVVNIAIFGAGAVGCYYGAVLARAGHAVTLVGRAAHVDAMRARGLLLETASGVQALAVHAGTEASGVRGAELVLCCVKSGDTEGAAAQMAPHLAPGAVVLSLQNGVDNAARLRSALAQEVIAAVVYVATEMAAPGHVRHHGRGELVLGRSPSAARVAALLAAAGIPTTVSEDVASALWAKLILNCAFNGLSAITRMPYGRLFEQEGARELMRAVVDECLAVASADGVRLPGDAWEEVARIARSMPAQFSSTAQDLARGRRSEIDHLNGYVVRRGRAQGTPVPVNQVLWTLVRLIEAQ